MTNKAVHAIILAAGRGSRLGPLTDDLPKCLTVVAGRPLLDWMLDSLSGAGIENILIVSGYHHQVLEHYQNERIEIVHNASWESSNMLGTLQCARHWLSTRPCIVSYSDIAVRAEHVARLSDALGEIVITSNSEWRSLWQARFSDPLADAESFSARDGRLTDIGRRTHSFDEINGQFMGLFKTTPSGWGQLDTLLLNDPDMSRSGDTTKLLSSALAENITVKVVECDGGWIEIDTAVDHDVVERAICDTEWAHDWRH
jgi:L-glutamine-phosphate cytidylyltransferase